MTGGMISGIRNFGIVAGPSVPPGIAASARVASPNFVDKSTPDMAAPALRNTRRVIIVSSPEAGASAEPLVTTRIANANNSHYLLSRKQMQAVAEGRDAAAAARRSIGAKR